MMVYDATMAGGYARGRRLRAADLADWMAAARPYLPGRGGRILDLGAGTGRFTAALAAVSGASVVACEPSGDMRAAAAGTAAGGALVGGAAEAIPFADGVFDAVWASQVVHHVGDLGAFAAEAHRVLAPGGHLLLRGGFGPREEIALFRYFPRGWSALSLDRIGAALAGAFEQRAHVQVAQVLAESPDEFVERARSRSLSNLAALPDEEFARGLRALEQDAAAGALPERIVEKLDLVVYRRRLTR